jgi:hypothetical protein
MVDSDDALLGAQLLLQRLDEIQQSLACMECLYSNTSNTMSLDEGRKTIGLWKGEDSRVALVCTGHQVSRPASVVLEEGLQSTVSRNTADSVGLLDFRVGIDPSTRCFCMASAFAWRGNLSLPSSGKQTLL